LVGRDEVLDGLEAQMSVRRFVTIVGPGGVGKTSVAVALGHRLAAAFDGDVCFFDVSGQAEPRLLVEGLALALGVSVQPTAAPGRIAAALSERRLLLILDGCESAIETAAVLAEELFHRGPDIHVLATSREALRAEGEYVCRLSPLPCPRENEAVSASRMLDSPAVQLFVKRAEASLRGFAVTDENAAMVGAICRKLDGLALAIEVAAGRVEAHSVGEIARELDSPFPLRWPNRRTAVARHQTLAAALDWSYSLLSEAERGCLRRVSLFPGCFTLDMAVEMMHGRERAYDGDPTEALGGLVAKSLVQCDQRGQRARYSLLDMTRDYARQKLEKSGELALINERHARLALSLVERHTAGAEPDPDGLNLADLLANVRAVLKVALDVDGDHEVAEAMVVAAAPIRLKSPVLAEHHLWMAQQRHRRAHALDLQAPRLNRP
jgi:predicted ATPase